jgi:hypothetical protein
MPLADLLRDYRDGDEHGWPMEFHLLRGTHWAHLRHLMESIKEHGIQTPILLGNDSRVWDGHHRLCVADMLGLADVPVRHA